MAAIDLPGLTSRTTASPLAALLGQTAETAQDGGIPADFAAMLAASQTAAFTPATLTPTMPTPASGKPTGKPGGKSLPDGLPVADLMPSDIATADPTLPSDLPEAEGEAAKAPADAALPIPVQPLIAAPLPQVATTETPGGSERSAPAPTAQPTPAALPIAVAAQVARIVAAQDGPRPAERAPQAVQVKSAGIAFALPAAQPAPAPAQVLPQAPIPVQTLAQPAAPAQLAAVPVAALTPRAVAPAASSAEAATPARRTASAGTDLPTAPAAIELPAEGMALRTDMAAAPAPAPQATGAPVPAATPAPHDFATLVDRLVEARDAALAGQSPQVVQSTLRHADFGQVSIRFETAGDGLSASLSSPDADFARAVQASASASQGSLNADQQGSQPRQDGNSAQPSFAQSQQRSPGQQATGAEARWRDAPAAAEPRGDSSDKSAAPQGRGIYA